MNERVEALIRQCTDFDYRSGTNDFDKEKFVRLIIKEYETLLPEICEWPCNDKLHPMQGWHVAFVARKHFGVE